MTTQATTTPSLKIGHQHSPLFAVIRDTLRTRILNGEFQPGERLIEDKLSTEMAVSRIPVREALRALAAEGLVTIEPRRGAYVSILSEEEAYDMAEVRAALEALNAKLAAEKRDTDTIQMLQGIIDEGMDAVSANDSPRMMQMNDRFHEALASIGGNAVLADIMRSLRDRTALLFAPSGTRRIQQNWKEHAEILSAVIAGDAERAAKLAGQHVRNTAKAYTEAKQER